MMFCKSHLLCKLQSDLEVGCWALAAHEMHNLTTAGNPTTGHRRNCWQHGTEASPKLTQCAVSTKLQ